MEDGEEEEKGQAAAAEKEAEEAEKEAVGVLGVCTVIGNILASMFLVHGARPPARMWM